MLSVKYGTKAAYTAITTKDNDALYFCTDTLELYKGSAAYSKAVKFVSELPDGTTAPISENVVYALPTGELQAYDPATSSFKVIGVAKVTTVGPASGAGAATDDTVPSALAVRTAIENAKVSPEFSGTPTAPTAEAGTNTTQIATTAFVKKACDDIAASLASAFKFKGVVADMTALEAITGQQAGDVYQVTNAGSGKTNAEFVWVDGTPGSWVELGTVVDLSGYAPLASPVFTGTPIAPTAEAGTNTTQIATTAFVKTAADAAESAAKSASDPAGSAAAAETAAKSYTDTKLAWGTF